MDLDELMELSLQCAERNLPPGAVVDPILRSLGLHECLRETEVGLDCDCSACDADRRRCRQDPPYLRPGDEQLGPRDLANEAHRHEYQVNEDTSGGRGGVRPENLRQFNQRRPTEYHVNSRQAAIDVLSISFSRIKTRVLDEIERVILLTGRAILYMYTTSADGKTVPDARLFVLGVDAPNSAIQEKLKEADNQTGLIFIKSL